MSGFVVSDQSGDPLVISQGNEILVLPAGSTNNSSLTSVIPSYLYAQYTDDDDLQAFVAAHNQLGQTYLDWFNSINLPIYTSSAILGSLLDWVAQGLYGIARPILSVGGGGQIVGPFNTWAFNTLPVNGLKIVGAQSTYYTVNDDYFKRIITWLFYKGDGRMFSVQWLKRRIVRFLSGVYGGAPNIDQTYNVSVSLPGNRLAVICISGTVDPTAVVMLKAGISSGVLETPFQYSVVVAS